MLVRFIGLVTVIALVACTKNIPVDFDHAYTGVGHFNSSKIRLGYLYLWDRKEGTFSRLDILDPPVAGNFSENKSATAEDVVEFVSGVSVKGGASLTTSEQVKIAAEVTRRTSLSVKGRWDRTYKSARTEMTTRINADTEILEVRWDLPTAYDEPDRFHYVLA